VVQIIATTKISQGTTHDAEYEAQGHKSLPENVTRPIFQEIKDVIEKSALAYPLSP
jgi:hypothetical protein